MKITEIHNEAWSAKYKRSIDCNNPKGFSQRAHCQGRKKNEAAYPAQQISRYNPDSETYRGTVNRIPNSNTVNKKDITAKGQRSEFPDGSYTPDPLANINKEQLEKLINDALGTLSKREEMVLRARFGIEPFTQDFNLQQVSDAMGISVTRVRQIEAKALRKLKHPTRSRQLRSMMDEEEAIANEAEQQELPIDVNNIIKLIQKLESMRYIAPEDADKMRRAVESLTSARQTINPAALLQLLTIASK